VEVAEIWVLFKKRKMVVSRLRTFKQSGLMTCFELVEWKELDYYLKCERLFIGDSHVH
jgi:hypothetical protein